MFLLQVCMNTVPLRYIEWQEVYTYKFYNKKTLYICMTYRIEIMFLDKQELLNLHSHRTQDLEMSMELVLGRELQVGSPAGQNSLLLLLQKLLLLLLQLLLQLQMKMLLWLQWLLLLWLLLMLLLLLLLLLLLSLCEMVRIIMLCILCIQNKKTAYPCSRSKNQHH